MNCTCRIARSAVVAVTVVGVLGACALGSGSSSYRLIEPQLGGLELEAAAPLEQTLAVGRPRADRTRDSSRILVREGRTLRPWAGVAWIDRAPELLRTLLIESLDGRVCELGREGEFAAAQRLELELRRFELVRDEAGSLSADVVLSARLVGPLGQSQGSLTIIERGF